jgi:hypothetical protein
VSNASIGSARTPVTSSASRRPVGWFVAWLIVGVALAFSVVATFSFGVFVAPFAIAGVVVLVLRHHFDRSAWGVLCGVGLLSLYVAWVQRRGPGTVSWHGVLAHRYSQRHRHLYGPSTLAGRRAAADRCRRRRVLLAQARRRRSRPPAQVTTSSPPAMAGRTSAGGAGFPMFWTVERSPSGSWRLVDGGTGP